ncbi:MAG: MFS transporter, partial [Angustibacter sp.]
MLAVGVDMLGTGLFVPVSLLYFTRVAGLDLPTVGALTTAGSWVSLPVPLLAGHLVDRWQPRGVAIVGQLLQAAGFLGFLVAREPAAVLAVVALVAVGQRVFWSSLFTLVAQLPANDTDSRLRDRRYALVAMAQAAGYGTGALLAGVLLGVSSVTVYQALAGVNAATFVASAALLLLVPTGGSPPSERPAAGLVAGYRRVLRDRPFVLYTLANSVFAICG